MLLLPALFILAALPLIALCAEDFYNLLGIDKSASDREIKRAYRTLSKKFHPDKNPGDDSAAQKFVSVAEAYEALIDPESRRIYDQYGHDGLKQHQQGGGRGGGGGHHDPFDLFSRFFGGSGHFGGGGGGGMRRGHNMEVQVRVSLRQLYTGDEFDFTVEKQAICSACEGSGSADGDVETCDACGGRGVRVQKHMLAPGIFQQVQSPCDRCAGKGKKVKNPCPVCRGARVVREPETHRLEVERGMPRGVKVSYENEADESPDWVAGDLIVQLVEDAPKPPPPGEEGGAGPGGEQQDRWRNDGNFFRRRGRDLFWREVLSLREAWMGGWERNVTHLDGHVVRLSRPRGHVVQPGAVEVVKGEGMPVWYRERQEGDGGDDFGALHVEYVVVLPDQMDTGMEKDFWSLWDKWRRKTGVDLHRDSGRPDPVATGHDEL